MTPKLETIIGLETHIELSTATKLFCGCANLPFGSEPNAHVCPVCMGFPGALPVTNAVAVEKAMRLSLALGLHVRDVAVFSRKNYFYPDLPMGFQISMYQQPLAEDGVLEITRSDASEATVRIQRLHIENDAGKLTHTAGGTLLDFNRAGVPLVEIVTHPDLRSPEEAELYAKELQSIARAVDASSADMEKGMMRFDASVSLRPVGTEPLFPRAEIKNLNSFKSLRDAIAYEVQRQTKLWEAGTPPDKEMTVGWLEDDCKTVFMRWKETADDYRYFDEPDIPPLHSSPARIEEIHAALPELPHARRRRYVEEFALDRSIATSLADPELAPFFEAAVHTSEQPKMIANWGAGLLVGKLRELEQAPADLRINPTGLTELARMVGEGTVSTTTAKEVLVTDDVWEGRMTPAAYVKEHGLAQEQDIGAIEAACAQAISENPAPAADVRAGKEKAMGALVGSVMKLTRGKAPVALVTETLRRLIAS